MHSELSCVAYYASAGKRCRDNSECKDLCLTPAALKIDTLIQGVCQSCEYCLLGCIALIEDAAVISLSDKISLAPNKPSR